MGKYIWGDEAFSLGLLGPIMLGSAAMSAACVAVVDPVGPVDLMGHSPKGPILVTLAWIWIFYNTIGGQVNVKLLFGNDNEVASHTATRVLMNMLEQVTRSFLRHTPPHWPTMTHSFPLSFSLPGNPLFGYPLDAGKDRPPVPPIAHLVLHVSICR